MRAPNFVREIITEPLVLDPEPDRGAILIAMIVGLDLLRIAGGCDHGLPQVAYGRRTEVLRTEKAEALRFLPSIERDDVRIRRQATSEARRVGKECGSTSRSRWARVRYKKKKTD